MVAASIRFNTEATIVSDAPGHPVTVTIESRHRSDVENMKAAHDAALLEAQSAATALMIEVKSITVKVERVRIPVVVFA